MKALPDMRTIKENIEGENPIHSISRVFTLAEARDILNNNPQIKPSVPRQTSSVKIRSSLNYRDSRSFQFCC